MIYYARARASVGERAHHVRVWAHMRVCARRGGRQDEGGEKGRKDEEKAYMGTEKRREFWKKRGAAKIFPRKFCGLKNNPYVCSA